MLIPLSYGSRLPQILDLVNGPLDFTSPVKPKKPTNSKSQTHTRILSPTTLSRIARPRRQDLSPTPFPLTSRKTFKSTPRKQRGSKSAGVLQRLAKTEVSMNRVVPSKKVRKAGVGGKGVGMGGGR